MGASLPAYFSRSAPHRAGIVGVFLVHAVDEDDEGLAEPQAVVHDALRADGQHAVGADDEQRSARRAQTFVPFPFEIVEAGQVEKVDLDVLPHQAGAGGVDGHLLRLFHVVEVGDRRPVRDFPLTVGGAAVEQHGFAKGGLALPAVSDDRNVADVFARDAHSGSPPICFFSERALFWSGVPL